MKTRRLDDILINNSSAEDKKGAFILVTEGKVLVDGQKAVSPSQLVKSNAEIIVLSQPKYVGRGAFKLEAALKAFRISPKNKICADIGSATGGFTEVLLKNGAKRVYAIDTARGKLALKLRKDPRVVVMEGKDVRDMKRLPEPVDIAAIDVSLITLREILVAAGRFLKSDGVVVALFKPQYETRNPKILKKGIVEDPLAREDLLKNFIQWTREHEWRIFGLIDSPIRGSKGNIEYLVLLRVS